MSFPSVAAQLLFQVLVIIFSSLSSFFASSPEECPQNESASLTPKGPAVDARNLRELGLRVPQVRQFRVGKTKKILKKNRRTLITDTEVSFPTFSTLLYLSLFLFLSFVLFSLVPERTCAVQNLSRLPRKERGEKETIALSAHALAPWAQVGALCCVWFRVFSSSASFNSATRN